MNFYFYSRNINFFLNIINTWVRLEGEPKKIVISREKAKRYQDYINAPDSLKVLSDSSLVTYLPYANIYSNTEQMQPNSLQNDHHWMAFYQRTLNQR